MVLAGDFEDGEECAGCPEEAKGVHWAHHGPPRPVDLSADAEGAYDAKDDQAKCGEKADR